MGRLRLNEWKYLELMNGKIKTKWMEIFRINKWEE